MPGLIGAIDNALIDSTGDRVPFVLLVFPEKGCVHATNLTPAGRGVEVIKELVAEWERTGA